MSPVARPAQPAANLELGLTLWRRMLLIRAFDSTAEQLAVSKQTPGHVHSYVGEEAVAVGVCAALQTTDLISSTHRGHGHLLAKGGEPGAMFAELFGRATGSNRGKGGSLHIADPDVGMLGAVSILGGGVPLAVGGALNAWVQGTGQVAVTFFGEGAGNEGILMEALNLAAAHKLPVVFVCENNLFAVNSRSAEVSAPVDFARRADGFGMPGMVVDGNDVFAVYEAAQAAVERARSGHGPSLIEAQTYRWGAHNTNFADRRDPAEIEAWKAKDPITRLRGQIEGMDPAAAERVEAITREVAEQIAEAVERGRSGPWPAPDQAYEDVFAPSYVPETAPDWSETVELSGREALYQAVHEEMARDSSVFLFGVDYKGGGIFGIFKALFDKYGPQRVVDAPLSEAIIVGASNGAALAGGRPIAEVQYVDFCMYPMDQIVNIMAKHRYLCGGRVKLPVVLRTHFAVGGSLAATHSQSLEAFFYHVPGLKVVMPSNPADAKGLLKSAIREDNPVIFLEPRGLYAMTGPVPTNDYAIPLGAAAVRREGRDATVVAFGPAVPLALKVAEDLAAEGISVEVIDPRTLVPLDVETILASVRKTGRLVVFQQASVQGGVGSDICRIVTAEAWSDLRAPVLVVGSKHIPAPYSPPLEREVIFNPEELKATVRKLAAHEGR